MTKPPLKENIVLKKLAITLAVPLVGGVCFPIYWYFVVPQVWLSHHKLTWFLGYTSIVIAAWILSIIVVFIGMCWKNPGCSRINKSQSTEDLWSEDRYIPEFTYTQPPPAYQTWATSVQPPGLATPSPPDEAWDFDYENKLEVDQGKRSVSKVSSFKEDQHYLYRTFGYPGPGPGDVSSPEEENLSRRQGKSGTRETRPRGSLPFAGEGGRSDRGENREGKGIVKKAQKRRFSEPQTFMQFSKDDVFDLSTDEENMTPPEPVCEDCVLARSCAEIKCLHPTSNEHTTSCVNCALSSSSCRAETLYQCLVETLQSPADTLDNETNVDSEDDNNIHNYNNDNLGDQENQEDASEEEQFKNYLENVDVTSEVWITTSESSEPTETYQKDSPDLQSLSPEPLSEQALVYSDRSPVYSDRSPVSDKKFDLLLASLQSLVIEIEKDFLESPRLCTRRMSASADGITSARKDMMGDSPRLGGHHLGRRLSASTDDITRTRKDITIKDLLDSPRRSSMVTSPSPSW